MQLSSLHRVLLAAILFAASWSTSSFAATVSIVPSGSSSYTVQGADMDGVAGIELNLTHDQTSTPTVTQGGLVSGAMLVSNTTRAGFIKIAIISTRSFTGSGPIATISFPSKSGSVGITSITSSMIDSKGAPIGVKTSTQLGDTASTSGFISSAGVPFSQPPQTQPQTGTTAAAGTGATTTTTTATAATSATPTYLGSVTLPQEQQHADHQKAAPTPVIPPISEEPTPVAVVEQPQPAPAETQVAAAKPVETQQLVRYKGIIDRFKEYKGSKTLAAMTELFGNKFAQLVRQDPAIVLSNGQNKAALTVDIPSGVNASPNFAVSGGTLIAFNQDKQMSGRWTIEILPEAGAVRAVVTIITKSEEYEFPLTVTPPAKTVLTLDESGWNRFMKETGTAGAPLHDLNNDGVRDYNDEYIFVANYLAAGKSPLLPARK